MGGGQSDSYGEGEVTGIRWWQDGVVTRDTKLLWGGRQVEHWENNTSLFYIQFVFVNS